MPSSRAFRLHCVHVSALFPSKKSKKCEETAGTRLSRGPNLGSKGAESLQSFTRSEYLQNSAANMEMQLREVVVKQMADVKSSLLGEGDGKAQKCRNAFGLALRKLLDLW